MGPRFAEWLPFIFECIAFTLIFILVNILSTEIGRRLRLPYYVLILLIILIAVIVLTAYAGGDLGVLRGMHNG